MNDASTPLSLRQDESSGTFTWVVMSFTYTSRRSRGIGQSSVVRYSLWTPTGSLCWQQFFHSCLHRRFIPRLSMAITTVQPERASHLPARSSRIGTPQPRNRPSCCAAKGEDLTHIQSITTT